MHLRLWTVGTLAAFMLTSSPAMAQDGGGFGIGPRITFVRGAADSPDGSQRFSGGMIRLGDGKAVLELAMDYRSGVTGNLTERIKDYPFQGSLLIYPVRARVSPYLLGGIGWYSQRVERFTTTGTAVADQTTRKMGYHAGFGGEVRVHRHIGLYGDYRYTMIRLGKKPAQTPSGTADQRPGSSSSFPSWIPFADRLKLSHQGSMFTWGAAFYF